MAIIKKLNKKNNTTYVYESISYWDKEKKQPRSKRKLIGKIDPDTGEIVPTGKRGRKPESASDSPDVLKDCENAENFTDIPATPGVDRGGQPDYQHLYEACRLTLLEKTARLANLESTIAAMTDEKDHLIQQLEDILHTLRH